MHMKVLAVVQNKGGVGKSTVAANLALALQRVGHRVGLMDSDIYGPSQQMMMGISEKPYVNEQEKIMPIEKFGVKVMSIGFLMDVDTPVIWRGPMVFKAVEQFLGDVAWGKQDFLLVDLPPGTGDAQLTLTQKVALEMLGFGPCYHMVNVLADLKLVPLWRDALEGRPDWERIFDGFAVVSCRFVMSLPLTASPVDSVACAGPQRETSM